jgi:hypothetical protein
MKTIYIILMFLILSTINIAQTIKWTENQLDGNKKPFYFGGFTNVSTEFADIDGDEDLDCFIGTWEGSIVFFENIGDSLLPVWKLVTSKYLGLSDLSSYDRPKVRLVDIDADNDLDMFIGGTLKEPLLFYRNTGSKYHPVWEFIPDFLNNLEIEESRKFCYPAFVDIDNDEDLDLIYGNYKGNDIFYENVGDKYTPDFIKKSTSFFGLSLYNNCHNIEFADIDNDSDFDALIGITTELLLMKNVGTADSAIWLKDTTNYFGINRNCCGKYYSPTFADLDNDLTPELYVGTDYGIIWYYDSIRSVWTEYNELYFDRGSYLNPEFADINGDGKLEMIIPCYNAYNDTSYIEIYSNIKSNDSIVWEKDTIRVIIDFPYPLNSISFTDVDSDNDLDLIAGFKGSYRKILFYRNNGNKNIPDYSAGYLEIGEFHDDQLIDFYPILVDYDNDNDQDIIISAQDGTMNSYPWVDFFENIGDSNNPVWEFSSSSILGYGAIDCIDDDNDGDLDLLFGFQSEISVVLNTGTKYEPLFEPYHNTKLNISGNDISGIQIIDLNNDVKDDLIIGTKNGGLLRYDNQGFIDKISTHYETNIRIYPNPANNEITISGLDSDNLNYEFNLYNIFGQLLDKIIISNDTKISLLGYTSGIYIFSISDDIEVLKTGKIIFE